MSTKEVSEGGNTGGIKCPNAQASREPRFYETDFS